MKNYPVPTLNPEIACDLDVFVQHYIIAALWSSTDEGGKPLDDSKYDGRLVKGARAEMRNDCIEWLNANSALYAELKAIASIYGYGNHPDCGTVDPVAAACANDLWLTRNGHGVGFWDRGLPEDIADRLTESAKALGYCDLGVSRGWIYKD